MPVSRNDRPHLSAARWTRRDFLQAGGIASLVGITGAASGCVHRKPGGEQEIPCTLAIVGGGVGGVAAAWAACRQGISVVLTEPTAWIGGQLTSQGVPPDEHPWIEQFGCTRSYREFRNAIRAHYRSQPGFTQAARSMRWLNPGNGWVSRLCHEPSAAHEVLRAALAPYLANGTLRLLTDHDLIQATTHGDRITSVTVRDHASGRNRVVAARWFIDASELGDLLPLAGVEHVVGTESRRETGELHAPDRAEPSNQQAFTWCFAMEYRPDRQSDNLIPRPATYRFWRDYVPQLTPAWSGRLLSWTNTHPVTLKPRVSTFDPTRETSGGNLWSYRRMLAASHWEAGSGHPDRSLVNWPQNDYWLGPLVGVDSETAAHHLRSSRELSLSLMHWIQTEAPRSDGGTGWPELRLCPGPMGTQDGLAMAPYIRESRRLRAEFTVLEQHVGVDARAAVTGLPKDRVTAEVFSDSVGVGAYRIDLHPGTGGGNYIDIGSLPFQIPLGSLIPQRVENLLAGAKNLGVTHITNGCYRLHPVEWNIGEAAGCLIAWCSRQGCLPRQVRGNPARLAAFQSHLDQQGIERAWPAASTPPLHSL